MVQEATPCLQVVGGAKDTSLDDIRRIFAQIEADLYRSDVYRRVQSHLQNLPQELENQMQRVVRAIGREAIRLAFRSLVKQRKAEAIALQLPQVRPPARPVPPPPPPPSPTPVISEPARLTPEPAAATPEVSVSNPELNEPSPPVEESTRQTAAPATPNFFRRRLSKAQRAALARQNWENHLCQLGQEIRQTREAKSISLFQMHCRTNIPIHQLEALETGQIDRLPEDIYIRGFLRQVGNALGWNGAELAASLPTPFLDPVKAILPSWYRADEKGAWVLNPMYLYVGYAVLMAGGLTWISQQTQWGDAGKSVSPPQPSATVSPQSQTAQTSAAAKKTMTRATLTPGSIAPPERNP
jgi:hypothetical protein